MLIGSIDACGYAAMIVFAPLAGALLEARGWPMLLGLLIGVSVLSFIFLTAFLTTEHRAKGR